jgi:hypothetical protein
MREAAKYEIERPDPKSSEGFIARALERDGLKGAVREAELAFREFSDAEIKKSAEDMNPKVRTAVLKMLRIRSKG